MAAVGWVFQMVRFLVSVFLSFVVFAAFMLWLVVSAAMAAEVRLEGEGQLAQAAGLSGEIAEADVANIRAEIEELRGDLRRDLAGAQTFLMVVVVAGLVAMGLIQLPNVVESLAWPGYTLVLTGVAALVLGWVVEATLPERVGGLTTTAGSAEAQAIAAELLRGIGWPGLWAVLPGVALVVASHLLGRRQKRARAEDYGSTAG